MRAVVVCFWKYICLFVYLPAADAAAMDADVDGVTAVTAADDVMDGVTDGTSTYDRDGSALLENTDRSSRIEPLYM